MTYKNFNEYLSNPFREIGIEHDIFVGIIDFENYSAAEFKYSSPQFRNTKFNNGTFNTYIEAHYRIDLPSLLNRIKNRERQCCKGDLKLEQDYYAFIQLLEANEKYKPF